MSLLLAGVSESQRTSCWKGSGGRTWGQEDLALNLGSTVFELLDPQ